jgi:hypothetical protein
MKTESNAFVIISKETKGDIIIAKNTQYNNIEADSVIVKRM